MSKGTGIPEDAGHAELVCDSLDVVIDLGSRVSFCDWHQQLTVCTFIRKWNQDLVVPHWAVCLIIAVVPEPFF